jgi:hypothetical protein
LIQLSNVTLPCVPGVDVLKRVVRARQFLEHAKSHAAGATDFDFMIATHGADNAIEFTLKLIADHVRYEEVSGTTLPETELAQIAGALSRFLKDKHGITLPYVQDIKALRQIRNLVQHGNFTPGSEVNRLLTIADRFFSSVCHSIFGLDAAHLRMASIIKNAIIQRHMNTAEDSLNEKRWEECVRSCRNAFEEALFRYRKDSPIALMETPARLAFGALGVEAERYIMLLSKEIDTLRLKIDSNRFHRFNDIIKHLPADWQIDNHGHFILQRPWQKSDAEYCYGFVSDNILRLQSDEFEPLYVPQQSDECRHDNTIAGISINNCEIGCIYFELDHETYLFYATPSLRESISNLETGKIYAWNSKHYRNEVLETEIDRRVSLRYVRSELVTHDPPRWRVLLDVIREPLTWHRRDFKDGELVNETPTLQTCSKEDLEDFHLIDADAAQRVLDAREKWGVLNSEILRKIELTESQIECIESFTRI